MPPHLQLPFGYSSAAPSLTGGQQAGDAIYAAWKGTGLDTRIWWSSVTFANQTAWSSAVWLASAPINNAYTDTSPTLASSINNHGYQSVYAAWKQPGVDVPIGFTWWNGVAWVPTITQPAYLGRVFTTSVSPTLVCFKQNLYLLWTAGNTSERGGSAKLDINLSGGSVRLWP
jgi:hypothetical protein